MNIAIIPARGGSKRIPKKNIKDFCGKPIISYPIEKALKSKLFDHVFVSTDDNEIADIALQNGATVPFLRSKKLSDDFTNTDQVIREFLKKLELDGYEIDYACCIYPTTPLMKISDLKKGYEKIRKEKWETVFSATNFSYPIQRSFTEEPKGGLKMVFPENYNKRSQDLGLVFHDAGQFYWSSKADWINKKSGFNLNSSMILIPNWRVQDIDNFHDWKRAELVYKILESKKFKD